MGTFGDSGSPPGPAGGGPLVPQKVLLEGRGAKQGQGRVQGRGRTNWPGAGELADSLGALQLLPSPASFTGLVAL